MRPVFECATDRHSKCSLIQQQSALIAWYRWLIPAQPEQQSLPEGAIAGTVPHLDNGGHSITDNKDDEDAPRCEPPICDLCQLEEAAEDEIDGGAEEAWRHHNEEVLHYKEGKPVWIYLQGNGRVLGAAHSCLCKCLLELEHVVYQHCGAGSSGRHLSTLQTGRGRQHVSWPKAMAMTGLLK